MTSSDITIGNIEGHMNLLKLFIFNQSAHIVIEDNTNYITTSTRKRGLCQNTRQPEQRLGHLSPLTTLFLHNPFSPSTLQSNISTGKNA